MIVVLSMILSYQDNREQEPTPTATVNHHRRDGVIRIVVPRPVKTVVRPDPDEWHSGLHGL